MSRCIPVESIPPMKDLTIENITDNVQLLNNQCSSPRLRYVFERLVANLHNFARETRLSTAEWEAGIEFITQVGKISTDLRAEGILLSDTLGLSALVDSINHPRSADATEGSVLGPFHTHDAPATDNGYVLHQDEEATKLFVLGSVRNCRGEALAGVVCDVWEGDAHGFYDVQNPNREHADGRAVLESNESGIFYFTAVVPVPYPIPMDGPVGAMLRLLNRHPNRPGHIHFMLQKEGYDKLVTALYPRGDPYECSDPVFGVKQSLIIDIGTVDETISKSYHVPVGMKMVKYNFVLMTTQEALELRRKKAEDAFRKMEKQSTLRVVDGLLQRD
ncbi:putative hydroxyquinol 1,2-dioxygenase [Dactylonectria macrodidyma]|uniref:Hydroxyquinol 1,2-dioxygenase n=1 Tax=Dactylonectria macrodidyma TaxID=307937 RepID=A0A9P9JKP7_9HYPO|nr:putative hydroxyquinol 1,2-dioxygenase [Dactylonectria macrodidyma]